jgi:hypothetical protein
VLRLVYQNSLFGPLHFEYPKAIVRVGSCRDNDLVLLHASVRPYHCVLVFDEAAVRLLPPEAADSQGVLENAPEARRYGLGETLHIGDLALQVERSPNSVAVPPPAAAGGSVLPGQTFDGYWRADFEAVPDEARWLCGRCRLRLTTPQVHVLGLVGGRKYPLCPKCSQTVELVVPIETGPRGLLGHLKAGWRQLQRFCGRARRP